MTFFPYVVAAWLFVIGVYGLVTSRNLIHMTVCLSVVQSSTYVLLLSCGYVSNAGPPIFANVPPGTPAVDPVVQALALTDIVVGATVTALLLAMAVQIHKRLGTLDPTATIPMKG
jgi:multicomponent Na+:H+ antiporter subunit C